MVGLTYKFFLDKGRCWLLGRFSDGDFKYLIETVQLLAITGQNQAYNKALDTFNELQKLLTKNNGKVVGDLMTPNPLVVYETTNLEEAASKKTPKGYMKFENIEQLPTLAEYIKCSGSFELADALADECSCANLDS
ncbi:unnamed protein product [Dovyalis caffra]|uniref:Uncharacterized protein n=1 Tax=Dovyalis caffra TaxID=77055 RepID=A0AAV1RAU6_9ROSI|nr:unnamed protein product [Dovyalis caffra]